VVHGWHVTASLAALILVHVVPAMALLSPSLCTRLYGIAADAPLFVVVRHRAAFFVAVVGACGWALVADEVLALKYAAAQTGLSMVTFLVLYVRHGAPTALRTVAIADVVALVPLAVVVIAAFS